MIVFLLSRIALYIYVMLCYLVSVNAILETHGPSCVYSANVKKYCMYIDN